jgi:hypothetical protein
LLELGVSKRLHRLVLINKIAKEKARCQQHAALHTALTRLVQTLRVSPSKNCDDQEDAALAALHRRVNELVAGLPAQELLLEFKAKLAVGGNLCDLLLHAFAITYLPKVIQPKVALFTDEEIVTSLVERMKNTSLNGREGQVNALRALFILCRMDENKASAVQSGAIPATINVLTSDLENAHTQILGLAALLSFACQTASQEAMVKCGGIPCVVKCMHHHGSNAAVQEHGFALLWMFAQDTTKHDTFMEHGAAAVIISGMGEHRSRVRVQEHGCGLIRALCHKVSI